MLAGVELERPAVPILEQARRRFHLRPDGIAEVVVVAPGDRTRQHQSWRLGRTESHAAVVADLTVETMTFPQPRPEQDVLVDRRADGHETADAADPVAGDRRRRPIVGIADQGAGEGLQQRQQRDYRALAVRDEVDLRIASLVALPIAVDDPGHGMVEPMEDPLAVALELGNQLDIADRVPQQAPQAEPGESHVLDDQHQLLEYTDSLDHLLDDRGPGLEIAGREQLVLAPQSVVIDHPCPADDRVPPFLGFLERVRGIDHRARDVGPVDLGKTDGGQFVLGRNIELAEEAEGTRVMLS